MSRMLVIDGNSIVNRAFYGVKPLTTKDGRYTNAIVGFLNMLSRLRTQTEATRIAVAFDVHAPTFRHEMYDGYKAGRKGMPPELLQQMEPLKDILRAMGLVLVECPGYEADDILGTLAANAGGDGCFISTGDRDALQLVGTGVTVLLATTRMGKPEVVAHDVAAIEEKYGLTPSQLIDLKALQGDASDNIPGVPGVGEKTALELLHAFGSLDYIYDHLDTLDIRDSLRKKLAAGKDSAYMSRILGTICRTAPVNTDPAAYEVAPMDRPRLAALLRDLELYKWLEKLGLEEERPAEAAVEAQAPLPICAVLGNEAVEDMMAAVKAAGKVDVLATVEGGDIVTLELAVDGKLARIDRLAPDFDRLIDLLGDETVHKRTHDSKPLLGALLSLGVKPAGFVFDAVLAAYLLNPLSSDYSLPRLLQEYGPLTDQPLQGLSALCDRLAARVEEQGMTALLTEVEQPLAEVLADMENVGVTVDREGIAAFGRELTARIAQLQAGIFRQVGYEFNLNSPKQLGKALFEDLGLPAGKKTKSGYSTGAEVLEKLRTVHPVVDQLLEYRTLSKLNGTYCEGLLKVVSPDGRIRSVFNQTETRTGRISSSEPNLQNIPVRSEIGRQMRKFFSARPGWVLCDADYSQIELRVLAHMAGEPTMLQAFNTGEDIHRSTAAQVFGLSPEQVTPLLRSRAKAVNFGIIYGIGPHSLAEDLNVSYGEAKEYIAQYLAHFDLVSDFMDRLIDTATQAGYAVTLLGRRRPLPELKAGNGITRAFGQRVARNMPIQGTAADIIKVAMVRVYRRLQAEGLQAKLILQIHDELMVECPPEELERVQKLLKEEMEQAISLDVRMEVDVHSGETWYDAKG